MGFDLVSMWNWLYQKYVDLLAKYLTLKKQSTIYMGKWDEEKPTQQNKPSAHSSLTLAQAKALLRLPFPYPKYQIFYTSNTNSMEPFIDYNSVVVCEKITDDVLSKQPIVVGDICIYERDGMFIVHRVINKRQKDGIMEYYFQGDNNFWGDGWIALDKIKYRYVGQVQTRQTVDAD